MTGTIGISRRLWFLLIFMATTAITGCASDVSYRKLTAPGTVDLCPPTKCTGIPLVCSPACKGSYAVEDRTYKIVEQSHEGNYLLSYIEFDDQGWFHDMSQRKAFFDAVRQQRKDDPERDFLLVVYAHGWKHNAMHSDDNVQSFSRLLERLDVVEQKRAMEVGRRPRKIVGVYLGWRGASLTVPFVENLTFWTRKNTAERVGSRSIKQFLMELNQFRASLNNWSTADRLANPDQSQLIMIGHSFGGLVMYHALYSEILDRSTQIHKNSDKQKYEYGLSKSFGDFLLLVNPAFEGSAYEPLFVAGKSRCFTDSQRPSMAIITSQSDLATKIAFPAGRLYTWTQSAPHEGERETVWKTVGHLPRYRTHELQYLGGDDAVEKKEGILPPTTQAPESTSLMAEESIVDKMEQDEFKNYDGSVLKATGNVPDYFPYLVVSAKSDIIDGHNDIWNERFVRFAVSFIAKEVMHRPARREVPAATAAAEPAAAQVKTYDPFPFGDREACGGSAK